MTHTLHRVANKENFKEDYVILVMPARGINNDETAPGKLKKFLEIFKSHNAINMGGIGTGNMYDSTPQQVIDNVYDDLPMVHGVFSNREDLVASLKDIKDEDMGISIIVSGLVDSVDCCAREAGLKRHSVNYSLGIWGDKSKLPDEKILEITTMCGHAMISVNLVKKMISDVKKGIKTLDKAAAELAKPCVCGIFNAEKAKKILEELM